MASQSSSKSSSRKRRNSLDGHDGRRSRRDYDDEDGHYIMRAGDKLGYDGDYVIRRELGEGTFGKVMECVDRRSRSERTYAIKVIKSIQKYRDAARVELEILVALRDRDPRDEKHFIKLIEHFDFHRHICMVFPVLGQSLFDFMKINTFRPFSLAVVRSFVFQILECVEFCHAQGLTHTDLKPENILLEDSSYVRPAMTGGRHLRHTRIQVIDFGSATWREDHHTSIVSTRHYRAPEIILGLGWDAPCDLWSVGCIAYELAAGEVLFQTHDNLEHLHMMTRVFGPLPPPMRVNNSRSTVYFEGGELVGPFGASSRRRIDDCRPLAKGFPTATPEIQDFLHLLAQLLCYDPAARISAARALTLPFFTNFSRAELLDAGTAAPSAAPAPAAAAAAGPAPAVAAPAPASTISSAESNGAVPSLSRTASHAPSHQSPSHSKPAPAPAPAPGAAADPETSL